MIYSSFILSLILASGLGKARQDQALGLSMFIRVRQTRRPHSPTIGRCPSDSGFLAGWAAKSKSIDIIILYNRPPTSSNSTIRSIILRALVDYSISEAKGDCQGPYHSVVELQHEGGEIMSRFWPPCECAFIMFN